MVHGNRTRSFLTMEQLTIEQNTQPRTAKSCVFTGHRDLMDDFSARRLRKEVKNAVENGVDVFYNGMAIGFDLIAAETVLGLKKKYPHIKLIACVPCYGQEKRFSETDKKRYVKILKKADETHVLSQEYYAGCMHARDRFMADRADMMIAYCKRETGGAAFTVKYFKKIAPTATIVFV